MNFRILAIALLLALSASALPAAAQGSATMAISLDGLPPAPPPIRAGSSATFALNVIVTISNYQCVLGGSFDVTLAVSSASSAPPGVTPTLDPQTLTYTIESGSSFGDPVTMSEYNKSMTASFKVDVGASAASGTYPVTVAATHAAGSPKPADPSGQIGCGPTASLPEATGQASSTLVIGSGTGGNTTGPGGNHTGPPGGNNTNPTSPTPAKSFLPGFEPLFLFGAAALVVAARRRHRQA